MDGVEIEVKIRLDSLAGLEERLRYLGACLVQERLFEDNIVLDDADLRLRGEGKLIRLRQYGDEQTLTYKGPASFLGNMKSRVETEVRVDSIDTMRRILAELGLTTIFRYQKYRTAYDCGRTLAGDPGPECPARSQAGLHILVDETPIGLFLELEGDRDLIVKAAQLLGYGPESFITKSYWGLYLEFCQDQGLPAGDMVF